MNEAEQLDAWIKFAAAALGAIMTHDEARELAPKAAARLARRYACAMLCETEDIWGGQ